MITKIVYRHTNINAENWKELGCFYETVFGLIAVGPERNLNGEWFERVTGIKGAHAVGQHYALPGYNEEAPTFEIFTYLSPKIGERTTINGLGFAHVAFETDDVDATLNRLLTEGGSLCGEVVERYYETLDKTLKIVYAKDPEGNIVEIMKWLDK